MTKNKHFPGKNWAEIGAVTTRILTELWRRKRNLIFWAIFPALVLILNSVILAERAQLTTDRAFALAAPGTLVGAALFFSCTGGTLSTIVAEREQQTLKRLFLSPMSGLSYFIGIFLAHFAIGVGQALFIYAIAFLMKAEIAGSLLLGWLIIFLSMVAYVGVGFILGANLAKRTEDVNSLVATFGVPLLILGGVFIPSSVFPKNLLSLAKFNPVYHINQALTAVWADNKTMAEISDHLWFLIIFAVLMVIGAWLSYQQMLYAERRL